MQNSTPCVIIFIMPDPKPYFDQEILNNSKENDSGFNFELFRNKVVMLLNSYNSVLFDLFRDDKIGYVFLNQGHKAQLKDDIVTFIDQQFGNDYNVIESVPRHLDKYLIQYQNNLAFLQLKALKLKSDQPEKATAIFEAMEILIILFNEMITEIKKRKSEFN